MSRIIELTQGYGTIVDDEDYDLLSQVKWFFKDGYAVRTIGPFERRRQIFMQNVIMEVDGCVDHADRNPLNNQRHNLRIATKSFNSFNRVFPKRDLPRGVRLQKNRYRASIQVDGVYLNLGLYDTPQEAEQVYLGACLEHRGELPPRYGEL